MKQVKFYIPGSSLLHRMHPSTKLALYATLSLFVGVLPWRTRWIFIATVFVSFWLCGISPAKYKVFVLITLPAVILIPFLNGLLAEAGDPLTIRLWGNFGFHQNGLERGLDYSSLYGAMAMLTVGWLTTTQIWEIPESLTMLGLPHTIGFVVGNVIRYMPEVAEHALEIADVQRSRGVDFGQGAIWDKFWKQCRLLASLLILEFSRLRTKTNAYESRGYSSSQRPTPFILPEIPRHEKIVMVIAVLATVAVGAIRLLKPFGG